MTEARKDSPKPLVFELLAEIATGPTARVELCRVKAPERDKGKFCAVKRLHPHIAEDPQFQSMFIDEVWMTAALDHPNVVRVVGWGNDGEGTYLAVELIEGVSLARLMKTVFETREAFTERMVVFMGSQICAGLAAAHGLQSLSGEHLSLVHRDLTPGNVLVGFDGRVMIADFGLAKAKQRVTKTLTGLLKGHPHYMAPEQATDGPIDGRADLFSLGVLLFELFTGRHPWSGGNELEIFHVMANEPPEDILSLRPKLDKELAVIVDRLLEKDPDRRYGSADEVRAHLERWLDTHGYKEENAEAVARFVRRNAMRQQRWFERAVAGEFVSESVRAKARLLGTRSRTQAAAPQAPVRPAGALVPSIVRGSTQTSVAAARRRVARKVVDDPTDETEQNHARVEDRPSNESAETPDWGEEIPTQVQTNRQARDAVRSLLASSPTNPRPGAIAFQNPITGPTNVDSLPSFADDESDGRTTTVKAKAAAMAYQARRTAPTVRESNIEEEVPTTPLGRARGPLGRLPPPPRIAPAVNDDDDPEALETRVDPIFVPEDRPTQRQEPNRNPIRTEGDLRVTRERLVVLAARMQQESDEASRLAAHRSLLADLARDAALAADESLRQLASIGLDDALRTMEEARRLETAVLRGAAGQPLPAATDSMRDLVTERMKPISEPQPLPAQRPQAAGPILAGAAQGMTIGAPPDPMLQPPMPLMQQQGDRQSFLPPPVQHPQRPDHATFDPRREPTVPGVRFNVPRPPEAGNIFSGEVFGVPVWVALAVAFLIAVGVVILVDVARR